MPLETGDFITDLIPTNPDGDDDQSQGDDHVRLLKKVIQQSFPNIDAAVTKTALDMNNGVLPIGAIIMWSGNVASIPVGWALCDGTLGTPDLGSKFVRGATGDVGNDPIGTTGGTDQHAHGAVASNDTFSQDEFVSGGDSFLVPANIAVDDPTAFNIPAFFALAYIMRIT